MGHAEKLIVDKSPRLGHGTTCLHKYVSHDRGCRYTLFFKENPVEHTARAAGASISDSGNNDVTVRDEFFDDLLVGRYTGVVLSADDMVFSPVILLKDRGNSYQQFI